ncbi:hypothetical protein RAA17_15560 [Komagataeibacter rhaeticus]|nr:hypothetical protein [Komagataeibacter rhaeticus]
MGLDTTLRAGNPADLVIFEARDMNQLVTRPAAPRTVIRHGRVLDARVPAYAELEQPASSGAAFRARPISYYRKWIQHT